MKALYLVAHGSRRQASNDEVRALTEQLAKQQHGYQLVRCGFLELAEPSIPDGISALVKAGAHEVVVLPYFLSAGRHVADDIPSEVEKAKAKNPDAIIRIAPYIGGTADMPGWLASLAEDAA